MSGAVVTPDKEAEVYGSWYVSKTDLKIPVGAADLKLLPRAIQRVFLLGAKDATESFTTGWLEYLVIRESEAKTFTSPGNASL